MTELNYIDYLIIALLIIYAYEGYSLGFLGAFLDLANFITSFIAGLVLYGFLGKTVASTLSIPQGFSNAISFFVLAFLIQIVIRTLLKKYFVSDPAIFKALNQIVGIFPGILSGLVLSSFLLYLVIATPISSYIKDSIFLSKIGKLLVSYSQTVEKDLRKKLGGNTFEALNFLTINPKSNEKIKLNFGFSGFNIERNEENNMFDLVNKERVRIGLPELAFDDKLRDIGRKHCGDMFANRYFSHYSLNELSYDDRMIEENIIFNNAGENLVLSPNAGLAMEGLMGSSTHRANILSFYFQRLGIGVVKGGIYGKMFCQEFTD